VEEVAARAQVHHGGINLEELEATLAPMAKTEKFALCVTSYGNLSDYGFASATAAGGNAGGGTAGSSARPSQGGTGGGAGGGGGGGHSGGGGEHTHRSLLAKGLSRLGLSAYGSMPAPQD
jgi:hypothetical protein